MADSLIIVGGGEHARVVADALRAGAVGPRLVGFVDPDPNADIPGLDHLGPDERIDDLDSVSFVLGVGSHYFINPRPDIVRRMGRAESAWVTVVHPSATIAADATIGRGTVVLANAVVGSGARLGTHVVVNSGAVVEHDVTIGDHSIVGPGVLIGGGTVIGKRVQLGIGSSIRDHVAIGDDARIAMGAVVVRPVNAATEVRGIPAEEPGER